jgi:hypothetical protein
MHATTGEIPLVRESMNASVYSRYRRFGPERFSLLPYARA